VTTIAFLVNPASANGSTGRRWPEIANRASSLGLDGRTHMSEAPGHLAELVGVAAADGAQLVVAVGGDGTVHEVARGLLELGARGEPVPELAVLPRGTGTDFVRTFRIPAALDAALLVARDGEPRSIDAGRVSYTTWDGHDASSWFVNVASVGMSGAIARRANETTKLLGGKVSFLVATLAVFPRWRAGEMTVRVDDVSRDAPLRDVVVANCRFLAGGMKMCPDALPDDGLFDVLTIGEATNLDLVLTMPKIYRGTHLPHPKAELLRGAVVSVDAPAPVPIQLDGEQPGTTPVRFEIAPRALRVRTPAGAPLA
jgi:YegS/Rv2252/BmrU family lipid kinase